jgi:hypothetical protein
MTLTIAPEETISALQAQFQAEFPHLKLVFFTKPHKAYEGSPAKFLVHEPTKTLGELNPNVHSGSLFLEADMPTWQVERLFEEEHGLHVQVFRKSGHIWLETSVSDSLSLEQQEAKGRSGDDVHQEFVDPIDYREQL